MSLMQRKKNLLFILLFIVASFTIALHELSHHDHSESCQVCVVDEHSLSFDVVVPLKNKNIVYDTTVKQFICNLFFTPTQTKYSSRAPPLFS